MIITIASNSYVDIEPICKAIASRYGLKYESIENNANKEEGFFRNPKKDTIYKGMVGVWKINEPDVKIFLKESKESKIRFLVENRKINIDEANKVIEKDDSEIKEFFVNNYGIDIRDYGNYDLVINVDKINQDGTIGVIEKYLSKMKK